jgi:hypothetical protein
MSQESQLVPLVKSKKLAAIRKQALQFAEKNRGQPDVFTPSKPTKQTDDLLKQAQEQVDAKINEIMANYVPGKKNKMFALKYGSPESIKKMSISTIFSRLHIVKSKKFMTIENLDYFGIEPKPAINHTSGGFKARQDNIK